MSAVSSTSELTTKEIVEQAIQDYHESILPYLNGQVPVIANKFDKANLYSTDEKIVGRWIDGKPMYQKTVNCGNMPDSTTKNTSHNISNIDKIVGCEAFGVNETTGVFHPFPLANDTIANQVWMSASKTNISIWTGTNSLTAEVAYVTLKYTKTTDEAIEIGSDTDYSLEEKIVGTDTDGTPIWQKTLQFNSSLTGVSWTTVNGVFPSNAKLYDASNLTYNKNGETQCIPCIVSHDGTDLLLFNMCNTTYASQFCELTIQYTKTTD